MKFKKANVQTIPEDIRKLTNKFHSTDTAIWVSNRYKGFTLMSHEDTEDNRERGNHIPEILDSIINHIKWQCARHNKVTVIRFDIYMGDADIKITAFLANLFRRLRKVSIAAGQRTTNTANKGFKLFKDIQYQWVREKGSHNANEGLHYHCFTSFRYISSLTIEQVQNEIRNKASLAFKSEVQKQINKESSKRKITKLESIRDAITPDINSLSEIKQGIPYLKVNGFFRLNREMLDLASQEIQKQKIIEQLKKDEGYKYLKVDMIKIRKHNNGVPVGGVLQECIYALSYLSKVVTKEHLAKNQKKFGKSSFRDMNLNNARKLQIDANVKRINVLFKMYEEL